MQPCGQSLFCCYGLHGCDCKNSSQVFSLSNVQIVTTIASLGTSSSTSSTVSSSPSTSITSGPAVTTPPASSQTAVASSSNSNLGVGLGVGLGVPLVLAVVGGLWFLRRKQNRAAQTSPDTFPGNSTNGAEPLNSAASPLTEYYGGQKYKPDFQSPVQPPQELHTMSSEQRMAPQELYAAPPGEYQHEYRGDLHSRG